MTTNFLWFPGSGNNGQLVAPLSLMTTEIESLANAAVIISSVNGSSGTFNTSNTSQGIWADVFFSVGNPGLSGTVSAGGNIAGWYLTSLDGSTFESTTVAPPRSPDFIIPVSTGTVAAGRLFKADGLVLMPALPFKVLVQNNLGGAVGSGATTAPFIKAAPVAVQY